MILGPKLESLPGNRNQGKVLLLIKKIKLGKLKQKQKQKSNTADLLSGTTALYKWGKAMIQSQMKK